MMDFGKALEEEGWTIVVMRYGLAIPFTFEIDHPAYAWVVETIPEDEWKVVSFRRIAFKSRSMAIMFKVMWG